MVGASGVSAAIALHVAMGAAWTLITLLVAIKRAARPAWLRLALLAAVLNMLAGIGLWHALHRGPWGRPEHLLVLGTFCGFLALGLQAPVALAQSSGSPLGGPPLMVIRVTAAVLLAAAAAMIGSHWG